jgi:large subunit ribosomal protein L24
MKLKKGDEIIVTGGKDRGKRGKIDRVFTKEAAVLVLGINMFKRHMKKRDEKNQGGIVDTPRPLPVASVALICPKCKQPTRVGYVTGKDGDKTRICRKCEQVI